MIWQHCPKASFAGRKSVEIIAANAFVNFSDGPSGIDNILSRFGVSKGYYTIAGSDKWCKNRKLDIKNTEKPKRRRKILRAIKKG